MERKNVNLTDEQCQEIIEEIATTSLHRFESGNAQTKVESKGTGIENFSVDDIMPEPIPSMAKRVQTETKTSVAEEQPATPTILRRVSSRQRKLSLEEYRNAYLKVPTIIDRKPVFVSCEVRDRLEDYVRKLGGRKMSVSGLLENIARQHLDTYDADFEQWRKL